MPEGSIPTLFTRVNDTFVIACYCVWLWKCKKKHEPEEANEIKFKNLYIKLVAAADLDKERNKKKWKLNKDYLERLGAVFIYPKNSEGWFKMVNTRNSPYNKRYWTEIGDPGIKQAWLRRQGYKE